MKNQSALDKKTASKQQQQNQQQGNDMLGMPQHFHYQYTTAHVKDEETQSNYHQQISETPPGDLLTIMLRQNEITAALVQQQRSLSLPPRDIPTFDRDPFQHRAFI